MIELIKKTNIDFMGKKYYAFALSGIIFILGIITVVQIARGTATSVSGAAPSTSSSAQAVSTTRQRSSARRPSSAASTMGTPCACGRRTPKAR